MRVPALKARNCCPHLGKFCYRAPASVTDPRLPLHKSDQCPHPLRACPKPRENKRARFTGSSYKIEVKQMQTPVPLALGALPFLL